MDLSDHLRIFMKPEEFIASPLFTEAATTVGLEIYLELPEWKLDSMDTTNKTWL